MKNERKLDRLINVSMIKFFYEYINLSKVYEKGIGGAKCLGKIPLKNGNHLISSMHN